MPRRIDLGRAVLVAGAALLIASLFTRWYDTGSTGWEVFETLDLVLTAIALGAMFAAVRPDLVPPWAGWALPGAALAIVIVQILNAPPAAAGGDPSTGAWLALGGALLMAAGSALSLTAISVTIQVAERDVRRRVPAVDRRAERDDDLAGGLDADVGAGDELVMEDDPGTPPASASRFGARQTPSTPRTGRAGGARQTPSTRPAGRSGAEDLERTQPLPDADPEGTDRP